MKVQWKKVAAMCAFAFVASTLAAADMPRSEWLGKIGDCAQNAATMADTMSKVSASDQVALVAEVNKALTKMAGSNEERAAAFAKTSVSAMTVAMSQNREKRMGNQVLAEIYATVPPEHLAVVSEQLAKTVLTRGEVSKENFIAISTNSLNTVSQRLGKGENAGVRETFAAIAFIKALGEPVTKELVGTMLSQIGDAKTRETAINEWIGPALGINGNAQSYDPLLGAANAGDEPDRTVVESLLAKKGADKGGEKEEVDDSSEVLRPMLVSLTGGNDITVAMLADLRALGTDMETPAEQMGGGAGLSPAAAGTGPHDLASDIGLTRVPRAYVNSPDGVGGNADGKNSDLDGRGDNPFYKKGRGNDRGRRGHDEPHPIRPYAGQNLKAW